MRKIYLAFSVLLATSLPMFSYGQDNSAEPADSTTTNSSEHFGLKAGYNVSRITNLIDNDKEVQNINFGLVYRHNFNDNWSLQVEPGYQQVGTQSSNPVNKFTVISQGVQIGAFGLAGRETTFSSDSVYKIKQLSLPVLLGYYRHFGKFFVGVNAGFALDITLQTSFKHSAPNTSTDTVLVERNEHIDNPQLVLVDALGGLHLGFKATEKLEVGLTGRYSIGLDGITYAIDKARYNNMMANIQVTYRLGK